MKPVVVEKKDHYIDLKLKFPCVFNLLLDSSEK